MLHDPRCIAPALLASFVGLILTAAACAEPASPAGDADCLAKPDGQAAPGNHWYYHVDRASGRHCWYQRAESGVAAQNDTAPSRSLPSRAPAGPAATERAADTATDPREQGTVPPVAAAPAQPDGWATATPAQALPESRVAPASDSAASALEPAPPQATPADPPAGVEPPVAPPSRAPVRAGNVERPTASAEIDAGSHVPALLGAALALLIIVLGSIVARIVARVIRSRRRARALDRAAEPPPVYPARDAPSLVPVMPREREVARKPRPPRRTTAPPAARQPGKRDHAQDASGASGAPAARMRADTRALEENVRNLLVRLNRDILGERPSPAAPAAPPPSSAEELDQALAAWRGRRRQG